MRPCLPLPQPSSGTGAAPSASIRTAARKPSLWLWLVGVVALVLVGYVGYGYYQLRSGCSRKDGRRDPDLANQRDARQRAFPGSATPIRRRRPVRPVRHVLGVKLTQLSWMRVIVDGNVILEGEFPPGTVRDFRGKHVTLLVGNAGGVEVTPPGNRRAC